MKQQLLLVLATGGSIAGMAQQTRYYNDPQEKFKEAKEYFQKEQYSLAYPLLKELHAGSRETDRVNYPVTTQELNYYTIVCGLKQNEEVAETKAIDYIDLERNNARVQMMSYHLGEYYFRVRKYPESVRYYEQANIANLSNAEIARMKFNQGYAYFTLQQFAKAKPLFNTVRSMKDNEHYLDANYYYGVLAFRDAQYEEALGSFRIVENEKEYATVVPYYIAQIYYIQGKKDEALAYAENKLKTGSSQYYDLELKQMIGHAYFERKEYAKALPFLEDYVARSEKVKREDLYELSYCYYQTGNLNKAIEGFKQLSGKEDALSQHAMYLLGDAYLKTGQKTNARNAFLFCASNSSNAEQKEISRYQYAKLSYELGYQDEALNGLRSFLTDYPNSTYTAEARELLVAVLANTNNYRDALTLLEGVKNPSENAKRLYPRILYGRSTELINDGRLAEANTLLDRALKDPNAGGVLPLVNFWKGELAYRTNKVDDAIKFYHAYLDGGAPASGEASAVNARYNLGYCYLRKENYPVALTFFEPIGKNASLKSDELTQDAYLRTADCYFMEKNYARAKSMYDNVVKYSWPSEDYATFQNAMIAGIKSPKDKISLMSTMTRKFPQSSLVTDANMEIANSYISDERFNEAIPFLKNVIGGSGNASLKPQAYLKLGLAYYNMNNNTEALKQYQTLVSQYPNSPEAEDALNNIRTVYLDDNKTDEYAAYMRQAGKPLSVSAEDSLSYSVAESHYQANNINAALTAYNNYLQKFPTGVYAVDAQFNRAEIYNDKKDWNNALKSYEFVAGKAPNVYAERAILEAARINFFEKKDYAKAELYYGQLNQEASSQENKLEAMRGLLRSQYQQEKWTEAVGNAKELAIAKGSSSDDKALANMAIAKSYEVERKYDLAIGTFRTVVSQNKAALAAEARYEIANCLLAQGKLAEAEKAAFETVNKSGSYDFWVVKSYILLGDIYFRQKDYFNAKATFQSIVDNAANPDLKSEAQAKLDLVTEEEKKDSKIGK
ncbi:tetratricopeptide repeat protein [Terrimonas ferruginea]|uniref:tetratricopeptide repeat protein n=1 Tax=Terrimonas ferruginea TaxID=249 RepID=UPI00042353E3|nr:tetratricopeptide repeat protein [Terrimonas ferruginea]